MFRLTALYWALSPHFDFILDICDAMDDGVCQGAFSYWTGSHFGIRTGEWFPEMWLGDDDGDASDVEPRAGNFEVGGGD